MPIYFERLCQVVVENKSRITIDNCRINFEITKSSEAKENNAKIEIYNVSRETRNLITEEDSLVRILAGYEYYKGLIEIGQGDISNVRTNKNTTDVVTEIYLAEGLRKTKNKPVSISYAYQPKLDEILSSITEQTSFSFRKVDIDGSKIIQSGYSDLGPLDNILSNLALKYDFEWSMQNGVILIKGNKVGSKAEIMLFTPETGLILSPESVKKISRNIRKSDISTEEGNRTVVNVLLQPQLQVYDIIAVESEELKGKFKIFKITHTGDTRGNDWYSKMEVMAV